MFNATYTFGVESDTLGNNNFRGVRFVFSQSESTTFTYNGISIAGARSRSGNFQINCGSLAAVTLFAGSFRQWLFPQCVGAGTGQDGWMPGDNVFWPTDFSNSVSIAFVIDTVSNTGHLENFCPGGTMSASYSGTAIIRIPTFITGFSSDNAGTGTFTLSVS